MANIITGIRIAASAALLFFPAMSPAFYIFYLIAGISDMIDGAVARKTDTASEFGERLDSFADIVFATVCLIKLLPVVNIPLWLSLWMTAIAIIKLINIIAGVLRMKKLVSVHSVLNKATGALCFAVILTIPFIDLRYSAAFVCVFATAAAVQETYLVLKQAQKSPKRTQ
jgi:CDP-diacylglycerol--glycerol-3-phosphate 3-phosphatidyltransferase